MAKSVKKPAARPRAAAKPRKPVVKKTAKVVPISVSHEEIAQLAHRFYAERGHVHGYHEDDWFRAELELRAKAS